MNILAEELSGFSTPVLVKAIRVLNYELVRRFMLAGMPKDPPEPPRGLSLRDTADWLGFRPDTLRHWLRHRRFRAHELLRKEGGRWRSTPLRIAHWRDAVEADRQRTFTD